MEDLYRAGFWWSAAKNNGFSNHQRKEGDEHFKARKYSEALLAYNLSVCFALPGSEELGLAYGCRSAVYLETQLFGECLENIKLARENKIPVENLDELEKREESCKHQMKQSEGNFNIWSFFKLSLPEHDKIPFITKCLELQENDKFGRHIVTSSDLKAGDVIAIEKPFFTFLELDYFYRRCWNCLKSNNLNLIPCSEFAHLSYCSVECQIKDSPVKFFKFMKSWPQTYHYEVLRIFFKSIDIAGGVDELISLVSRSECKTVFDFDLSDPEEPEYERNLLIAFQSLSKGRNLPKISNTEKFKIPTMSEKPRSAEEDKVLHEYLIDIERICKINTCNIFTLENLSFEQINRFCSKNVGYGIYPFMSLLNHSCYPNVNRVVVDGKAVLIVARPIASGDQLFIAYNAPSDLVSRAARRHLMAGFDFTCDCEACVENYPLLNELPRKDPDFVSPEYRRFSAQEAIDQFKTNCKYIDSNARNQPSYEISSLFRHNIYLIGLLAKDFYCDVKVDCLEDLK